MMSGIRGKGNASTEVRLMRIFRKYGISGWRRQQKIEGNPDFVFRSSRVAVFVDGCFWHGCPKCYKAPSSNSGFWKEKLTANRKRDRVVTKVLMQKGWKVVRFWECALASEKRIAAKLRSVIEG